MVAEAGMAQEVADFHKQILDIITLAKETGEKEHAAAIMAISLISLDLAEESGVQLPETEFLKMYLPFALNF